MGFGTDPKHIAEGWALRRAELEDFARVLSRQFAATDSSFDAAAFLRVALA